MPETKLDVTQSFEFLFFSEVDATLRTHPRLLDAHLNYLNRMYVTYLEGWFDIYKRASPDRQVRLTLEDFADPWGWGRHKVERFLWWLEKPIAENGDTIPLAGSPPLQALERRQLTSTLYSISDASPTAFWSSCLEQIEPSSWTKPWTRGQTGLYLLQCGNSDSSRQFQVSDLLNFTGLEKHRLLSRIRHFVNRGWMQRVRKGLYAIQNVYPAVWFWIWLEIDHSLWYRQFTLLEMSIDLYEHCQAHRPFCVSIPDFAKAWMCAPSWARHLVHLIEKERRIELKVVEAAVSPIHKRATLIYLNRNFSPDQSADKQSDETRTHHALEFESFNLGLFKENDPYFDQRLPNPRSKNRVWTRQRLWLAFLDYCQAALHRGEKSVMLPLQELAGRSGYTPDWISLFADSLIETGAFKPRTQKVKGPRPFPYETTDFDPMMPWYDLNYWRKPQTLVQKRALTTTEKCVDLLRRVQAGETPSCPALNKAWDETTAEYFVKPVTGRWIVTGAFTVKSQGNGTLVVSGIGPRWKLPAEEPKELVQLHPAPAEPSTAVNLIELASDVRQMKEQLLAKRIPSERAHSTTSRGRRSEWSDSQWDQIIELAQTLRNRPKDVRGTQFANGLDARNIPPSSALRKRGFRSWGKGYQGDEGVRSNTHQLFSKALKRYKPSLIAS